MTFTEKYLRITVSMREGAFKGGGNAVTIEGLPMAVSISKPGGQEMNKATATIDNMLLDTMQQLTVLAFRKLQTYNNVIKIEAGTKGQELNTAFEGEVSSAVPSLNNDGVAQFKIEAKTGYYPGQLPSPPVSVQGETTIEYLMSQFAKEAGYAFENRGITGGVKNCVFVGSPILKARTLARQTGIDLLLDDRRLIIQPYEAQDKGNAVLLSAATGLLGYPSFTNDGIECRALYNPEFAIGGFFKLETMLPNASGVWKITKLEHSLEANKTGGKWESKLSGAWLYG